MKKSTITIGIPAYNEAENIGRLLTELLKQREVNFELERIIVCSDGSSDETCAIVDEFLDPRITLIDNSDRKGKAYRQNQIIEACSTDILVLLDADIIFYYSLFINDLVTPLIDNEADFVAGKIRSLEGSSLVDKSLYVSMDIKAYIYEKLRGGRNVYTCYGPARAFSKNAYSVLKFDQVVAEDAYSYLYCIKRNLRYQFVSNAQYYIKLPNNIVDHQKQSIRFMKSISELENIFGKEFVHAEYDIPYYLYALGIIRAIFTSPFYSFVYTILNVQTKYKALFAGNPKVTWDMVSSSKRLK